jgi:hypothetical protein
MPLYTADALVLRTYKLAEADRIVVFLTADRGKKRGVAKSARRPRSRFVASLEPLTHVRVAYFEKETRELVSLNYAELVRSPLSASGDALVYASYFAELIDEWAPADDPNETLYRLGHVGARGDGGGASARKCWRGTSSTGCCGCRASTRRTWSVTGVGTDSRAGPTPAPGWRLPMVC